MNAELRAYAALSVVLLLIAAGAGGLWLGIDIERKHSQFEVATLKQGWSEASARAALADRQKLQTAQALGDALTGDLLRLETQLSLKTQEVSREIHRRTTGRACLDDGLVRVLNAAADPDAGEHLPETAGSAPAEDGAAATDTDVALWIANAREQYEICRARLGALIDFEEKRP